MTTYWRGWFGRLSALSAAVGALTCPNDVRASESGVVADDRDEWTLLYRHPVNRQLFEQLRSPEYADRLAPRQGLATALADVNIGTQQVFDDSTHQSRYHGWFLANSYAAVRPFTGLDANLNLLMLNPSASDGYRMSSSVHPGLALHVYRELFELGRRPVRFDLVGIDLGWITTGNGLMLESVPLEGILGVARWRDWELDYLKAGRAFWDDDDYETISLSALKRLVQINLIHWQKWDPPADVIPSFPGDLRYANAMSHAYHATLATRAPVYPWLRLATEFGYRIEQKPKVGMLGRIDVMLRERADYGLHLGYQFRFYQAGFGPRDRLSTPTWAFNSPLQQDSYATNSFEYLGLSAAYDQWSHSVMGEGRSRLGSNFEVYANTEVWVRYARASTLPKFATFTANGFRAPGRDTHLYYDAGLRYYPWPQLPHRLSASVTNKQAQVSWSVTDPVERRFAPGNFYVLKVEAYL